LSAKGRSGKKASKSRFKLGWKDLVLYGFLIVIFLFITLGLGGYANKQNEQSIPISQVIKEVKEKKVGSITVLDSKIEVNYKNGAKAVSSKEKETSIYEVLKNSGVDPASVSINVKDDSSMNAWVNIISSFLPLLLMVGFLYFIFRQARGAQESIFSFGSSKGKQFNKDFPKVTFDSVAGVDEAKQELSEVVDFLKNPSKYQAMGARTPKGVLLIGPSGTGKTLLARAVAGEAKVPFISIAGSEFMEMLVGVGAARVRDLFATAKKTQPAIIFIDEVDAIGRQRGAGLMGGHDEREQTLNQILVEMDGFTPNEQLVVMAATNRPDILDSALIRPGRFDRTILIGFPDIEGRMAILKIHAQGKPFTKNIDWERIAKRTVGYSGADLENMLNEAAIFAARQDKKEISIDDVEEAATKVKLGPQKKRMQTDDDKKITAYHEAGHALVSFYMPNTDPVHTISIVGRGMSLGHTIIPPALDRVHETRTRLYELIATMLGGRAAEELIFSEMTTGAADDIEKATQISRTMVTDYGMSSLGPISYDSENGRMTYEASHVSNDMQSQIDKEIKRIIDESYKRAQDVLKKHKNVLDAVAVELLKKEKLEGEEFELIIKGMEKTGNSRTSVKKSASKSSKK